MLIIPLDHIEVQKRQRTTVSPAHITDLKQSILDNTNIHPPVCRPHPDKKDHWILIVGECRLKAIRLIAAERKEYKCGDFPIPPGSIGIHTLSDLFADEVFSVELAENVHRENLSWQDRAAAYAELHTMRLRDNPQQTLVDTKKELIEMGAPFKLTTNASEIRESQVIADHLNDPKISNARNAREALALIYKKEEEKIQAVLVKRQLLTLTEKPLIEIRHGDLFKILPNLATNQFDLMCADPPYGIGASAGGFRARSVHHHNYDDTPQNAQAIAQCILTEGFRVTKPRANLFMFCDIDLFGWLRDAASNMGWTPFRRPLIWQKSESEGLAPWGSLGPRITTEFIFYATKGQRGMTASPVDWFAERRVPRNERLHAAEKPVDLLKRLIELTTLPGDRILDPCCGSGSTLVAAKELQRGGLGIEQDETYYNTALANVYGSTLGVQAV